jgi:SAM-dependent methyltransferase
MTRKVELERQGVAVSLRRHKQAWEDWGSVDALWSILTTPEARDGKWDLEEFWRLGEAEMARVMDVAARLGYPAARREALDFGCGVGRLTRAMTRYFERCIGVYIAESMIEKAGRLNDGYPCRFLVNDLDNLSQFKASSFDLVYSSLVLQHLPSDTAIKAFIVEFLRVLRPEGALLAFQLPSYVPPRSLRNRLRLRTQAYAALRMLGIDRQVLYARLNLRPVMQMNFIPEEDVLAYVASLGAIVLEVRAEKFDSGDVDSRTYFLTKR